MANALQEQLLKAGLVNEKQLKKARKEKRKSENSACSQQGTAENPEQMLRRQAEEKSRRDRELNRQRTEAAAQKELTAQIRQLVMAHRVPAGEGEQPYRFVDGGKVKQIYASEVVRTHIIRGRLAIVQSDAKYELVPSEVAERIRARSPSQVVLWNSPEATPSAQQDDEYSAYQVPDDLMW